MERFSHETMQFGEPELDPGFAISTGGAEWQTFSKGWAGNQEHVTIDNRGYSAHGAFASFGNQGSNVYVIVMGDIMESTTWESIHWGEWILHNVGKGGTALVSGYPQETVWSEGHWIFGMITDVDYEGYKTQVPAFFWPKTDAYGSGTVSWYPGLTNAGQITGCVDTVTSYAHFACKRGTGGYSFSDPVETFPPSSATSISGQFAHPDIIAHNSKAYLVYEYGDAIRCRRSLNNGASWQTYIVDSSGMQPKVVINEDETIVCYYIRDGEIIESISEDFGVTWSEVRTLAVPSIDVTTETPFDVTSDALVYATLDGGLKSLLLKETKSAMIHGITVDKNKVITTLVTNAGSTYLHNAQVRIFVEGVSPLGQYFGGGPLLIALFKGRVLGAAETIENMSLSPKENFEVTATAFGLGHVLITVQVIDDEEILAEKQEDGFLFGGRVLLFHEEE